VRADHQIEVGEVHADPGEVRADRGARSGREASIDVNGAIATEEELVPHPPDWFALDPMDTM
jgi:hypothetical protein